MRIYTQKSDEVHGRVILFLTVSELQDLASAALGIMENGGHDHVSDESYQKEITIAALDPASVACYDERSQRVINEDR